MATHCHRALCLVYDRWNGIVGPDCLTNTLSISNCASFRMSGFANIQTEDILNPDVYLNHLPSFEAQQIEISRNITVAVLGATIWDILVYVSDDIRIISRSSRLSCVTFCFIFSRISAVAHVFLDSVERLAPIYNIHAFEIVSACLLSLSAISSSYLFLQRAQAIYAGQKWLQNFFFISWLVVFGTGCMIPVGLHPSYISGTYYYRDSGLATYVAAAPLVFLLFDTIVFVAISYKMAKGYSVAMNPTEVQRASWIQFLSGRRLPQISKAVLRGGQQYYLITVGTIVLGVIGLCLPKNLQPVGATFPIVMIPLSASMACRVFRNLKLLEADLCTLNIV